MSFQLSVSERTLCESILRRHSITYYNATKFFPPALQDRVFALYAWVREADELVDNPVETPQKALALFTKDFEIAWKTGKSSEKVTEIFVRLAKAFEFEKAWCDAFLDSMAMDLESFRSLSRDERDRYIYGSAEVIGLMMARLMDVPDAGVPAARALGRWMQLVNFLRDTREDAKERGRVYIPHDVFTDFEFSSTDLFEAKYRAVVTQIVEHQLSEIAAVRQEFENGLKYLPLQTRFAIGLSIELYQWAVDAIQKEPLLVLERQLKPSKGVIAQKVLILMSRWLRHDSVRRGKQLATLRQSFRAGKNS